MKIFYIKADEGGSGFYRMELPSKYLASKHKTSCKVLAGFNDRDYKDADIIIMQRQCRPSLIDEIQKGQLKGKKYFYELDDDLWHTPLSNPTSKFWNSVNLTGVESIINICDGVIVSTKPLADIARKFNSNVQIIPNFIEEPDIHFLYQKSKNLKVKIGWAGSPSHNVDFTKNIIDVLFDIHNDFKIEYEFFGWIPTRLRAISNFIPSVKPQEYLNILATLNWDVGIIPCSDITMNKSKSNLKFLEYSICNILSIASPIYLQKGITANECLFTESNNYDSWYSVLKFAIELNTYKKFLLNNAREFAEKHLIKNNMDFIINKYQLLAGG